MKSFVTVVLIVVSSVLVICHEPDAELRKNIDECLKEHNVSPKDFHDYTDGKLTTVPEDIKCTTHCIMIKEGFMDEAGTFKPDAAKARVPNDAKFSALVDDCKSLSGSTACDTASKISQCLLSLK